MTAPPLSPTANTRPHNGAPLLREVVEQRTDQDPQAVVCHSVSYERGEPHAHPLTFRDLADQMRRARGALDAAGVVPGARVVLATENVHAFLAWFLAATSAGALAVPLPAPGGLTSGQCYADRARSVWADCHPTAVVTDDLAMWDALTTGAAADSIGLRSDPRAHPLPASSLHPRLTAPGRGDTAFLQYTSGSTSSPKGVRVTHGNLAANLHAIGTAAGLTRSDSMLSWLPLHHDMGLIGGLLLPIYWSMSSFVLPTSVFARRPSSWLHAMDRFRATLSVAPPSAYRLIQRHLPDEQIAALDLAAWRLAFCGAEPVPPTLADDLAHSLAAAGISPTALYPVYGLAEATLAVTFPPPGHQARTDKVDADHLSRHGIARPASSNGHRRTFVSVGKAMPGHQIHIMLPTSPDHAPAIQTPLPERTVGEITVLGPSLSPGYFGHPDRTDEPLRTGDLGYLADGELYVVDRLKDMITVGGRNLYPADIETHLATIPGIRPGHAAAFRLTTADGADSLAIAIEASGRTRAEHPDLAHQVSQAVITHFQTKPHTVALVAKGSLPRTTSGKIRRHACPALLLGT